MGDRASFNQPQPPQQVNRQSPFELGSYHTSQTESAVSLRELGLEVVSLDADLATELNLSANMSGLMVTGIDPAGPAAGRILQGEIIDHFGSFPIKDPQTAQEILKRTLPEDGIRLHVTPTSGQTTYPRTVLLHPNWNL